MLFRSYIERLERLGETELGRVSNNCTVENIAVFLRNRTMVLEGLAPCGIPHFQMCTILGKVEEGEDCGYCKTHKSVVIFPLGYYIFYVVAWLLSRFEPPWKVEMSDVLDHDHYNLLRCEGMCTHVTQ